jgi:hypothetical protein
VHRRPTCNAFDARIVEHPCRPGQCHCKTVSPPIGGVIVVVHAEFIVMNDQECKFRHSGIIAHSAPVGCTYAERATARRHP